MVLGDEEENYATMVPRWMAGNTDGSNKAVDLADLFLAIHACHILRRADKHTHDCCRQAITVIPSDSLVDRSGEIHLNVQLDYSAITNLPLIHFQLDVATHSPPLCRLITSSIFCQSVIKYLEYLNDILVGRELEDEKLCFATLKIEGAYFPNCGFVGFNLSGYPTVAVVHITRLTDIAISTSLR
ncbi:receptor type tyrosine protein phosphatase H [Echinococcus multilocularis]|uniref:Receptor type tyrosine protein phosphatase H n=1 Tax=Echinococcus multilocularis TaxID=6211 RepID=A0A0S4MLV9_ECHMU|nr:receptor type tyrosine protein phosphatase H [Echinococcus multilocularis]